MSKSAYFRLSERLQRGIASTLRWTEFRPVQDLTIAAVLEGKNTLVLAPTAGGKTEAAFFPVLDLLYSKPAEGVGCVYVSPLRALLNNQEGRVRQLARLVGLDAFKWHGDVGASGRNRFLKDPTSVLMTTPESLEVLLMGGRSEKHRLFDHLRFVIIDEIHAFAADDRGAHLMALLERIQAISDADVQRIGLSATVGNPEDLAAWMQGTSRRERTVVDPPRSPTRRRIAIRHAGGEPEEAAASAVPLAYGRKSIFFTQGRAATERVRQAFDSRGVEVFVHHSSVSKERREEAERHFMGTERAATMVSTSTLELGIDVGDLDLVLQLDAPSTVSSFLQRMGRTGRREGTEQRIEFFTSNEDSLLQAVALVNLAQRKFVEKIDPSQENLPIFLHQILAHVVQLTSVRKSVLWDALQGPAPFRLINCATFDNIVDHLLKTGILEALDHELVLGEEGERVFGGMNFFNLYSVFETPSEVVVKTRGGSVIGTLETAFVRKMEGSTLTFLLAGRTWRAVDVDLDRALVVAIPFAGGEAPRWHGAGGFLGSAVAGEMRNILLNHEVYRFVDEAGREEIEKLRAERRWILARDRCPITHEGDKLRLHTYAGGRINATIAALLERQGTVRIAGFGDLEVDLAAPPGGTLVEPLVCAELRGLCDVDVRITDFERAALVGEKSRGRRAKFQPYLPRDLEGSYLARELFDFIGAAEFARGSSFPIA
ncbi:MAG: DEAD/DEAH box helicase [Actinomycetota bacterium]|nr:DEAD/DEAH box helicase [Actinomycetota bacterium]